MHSVRLVAPAAPTLQDTRSGRRPVARRLLAVIGLYALSRVYSTVLLVLALWVAIAQGWHLPWLTETPSFFLDGAKWVPHQPNFADISSLWDAAHYQDIAAHGYPAVLPRDGGGRVLPNDWAFLPVYPAIVGALSGLLHTGFEATGVCVSLVFGGAATAVLYLLVRDRVGHRPAWFAAIIFAFGPLAFLLQVAYAESLFLFLFFAALYLMQRQRYWAMLVPAVIAAFTRPGEIALALALAIVFVDRWRRARRRRETDAFPVRERVALVCAGVVTALAGFGWPVVAWAVTGVRNAYTATELSWRYGFLGHTDFRPFTAWFELGWRYLGILGVLIVVVAVVGFAWWVSRRATRALGMDILVTVSSYALYLIAVFMPQQSVFRVSMVMAPLMGDPRFVENRVWHRVLLACAIAAQPVCVAVLWLYANP